MPGGAPGLQNQCGAEKVPGGFDSHSPPPLSVDGKTTAFVRFLPIDSYALQYASFSKGGLKWLE